MRGSRWQVDISHGACRWRRRLAEVTPGATRRGQQRGGRQALRAATLAGVVPGLLQRAARQRARRFLRWRCYNVGHTTKKRS